VKREEADEQTMGPRLRRTICAGRRPAPVAEIGIAPHVAEHVLDHVTVTRATIPSKVNARHDDAKDDREALDLWAERPASIFAGPRANAAPIRVTA
jgi:hypothetical protein